MINSKENQESDQELFSNINQIVNLYSDIMQRSLDMFANNIDSYDKSEDLLQITNYFTEEILESPDKLIEKQIKLYSDLNNVWWQGIYGDDKESLKIEDKRFKNEYWKNNNIFSLIKQSYLLTSKFLKEITQINKDVNPAISKKVEFYIDELINASSPSNFILTNPEVLQETINSNGQNLVKGFTNLLHDLEHSKNFLNISTTDTDKFILGENIACTKGKVVYKNELMELINYKPLNKKIYNIPILLIPAWINKYYILDLSEKNSYVKWLLEQGYDVFLISWVNPDEKLANKNFEDYMFDGLIRAVDEIQNITKSDKINSVAYCLGGTLLTAALAYMAATGDNRINSATLFTTLVDFSDVGKMSLFLSKENIDKIEESMKKKGYLDGENMSAMFSAIRSNDLIWSFFINNYLLGKNPFPFDILYWNSDVTRMPMAAHSFYLRNMYIDNALIKPNAISLKGIPIDVEKINVPIYVLSAIEDHIAPWKTTFKLVEKLSDNIKFVLSGSGHVAGVINPPSKNKYCYWENDDISQNPDDWYKNAQKIAGSWWENWHEWQKSFAGEKISSNIYNKRNYLYNSPGEYVKIK